MKRSLIYVLIVGLLLTLASCTGETPTIQKGSLTISVTNEVQKGIDSGISLDIAYYKITGEGADGDTLATTLTPSNPSYTNNSIAIGSWTITAIAYNEDDIAIGSGSTSVTVKAGENTSALISVSELKGKGTLTVVLNGLVSDQDTYALNIYKRNDGQLVKVGEDVVFEKTDGIQSASVSLDNGYYAFEISCDNNLIELPTIETVRIVKGDDITVTYTIVDTGDISISIKNEISSTPSLSINLSSDVINPETKIQATAITSNIEADVLSYSWYIDHTKLDFTEESIELDYEDIGAGNHYLICIISDDESELVWSYTVEIEGIENSSSVPEYEPVYGDSTTHPYLAITEEGAIYCIDNTITEANIPDYFNGVKVTALAGITEDGVEFIEQPAFWECSSLTSVTIPDSVTSIGDFAFFYCESLTEITIPDSVTFIGKGAFYGCFALTEITIPDSVTSIGDGAFYFCLSLTSITIPNSVTSIGNDAFFSGNYQSLESIYINNEMFSISGVPWGSRATVYWNNEPTTYHPYLSIDSNGAVKCIDYTITEAVIPEYVHGVQVTSIGDGAFLDCDSLTEITIPDSVTSIGSEAFNGCSSLTEITIPDSVNYIGVHAFLRCPAISCVSIPKKQKEFVCLGDCKTAVIIPIGFTSIGDSAFSYCQCLESITIPDSVTSIGERAFQDCYDLTEITIPDSVTSIGEWAFHDCEDLTEITIPDSVTYIGDYAFSYCLYLESITIPDSVTSIGEGTFYYCRSLTEITIPNSVTSIGEFAFQQCCDSLTEITIPDSVTSIGDGAFLGCDSLTEITIPNSVTSIGDGAFQNCTSLTSVTIGNSVTSIGDSAFEYCSSLESITIGNSVTSIGGWAFYDCPSLTEITIPNSVTSIGGSAFSGCSSLESIYIDKEYYSISGVPWSARYATIYWKGEF